MIRYFEDLAVGERFETAEVAVTAEDIVAFARDYDPQPVHLDAEAARDSIFHGLAASGWHTAALTMRLMVAARFLGDTPLVGLGVEDLRWPRAVRPGDRLRAAIEVLERKESRSKPGLGLVRIRTTTVNQHGETVLVMISTIVLPTRAAAAAGPPASA